MKTILVCLDASPRASHVLGYAVDLASRMRARLTLFRSVGVPPEIEQEDVIGLSPSAMAQRMVATAKQGLARLGESVPSELVERIEVALGTPWDAICREAEKINADLIVVGSHGYSALDRVLGTTAAKVVNHAECSVLVVR